jgi:sorbitol-specific phosphotransferase system component IIBC
MGSYQPGSNQCAEISECLQTDRLGVLPIRLVDTLHLLIYLTRFSLFAIRHQVGCSFCPLQDTSHRY